MQVASTCCTELPSTRRRCIACMRLSFIWRSHLAIFSSISLRVFPSGPDSQSLPVVHSSTSRLNSSRSRSMRFLVAGERGSGSGDSSYHSCSSSPSSSHTSSGEPYMTSVPDDGDCRPMACRHDSLVYSVGGGLSARPPSASCPHYITSSHMLAELYLDSPRRRGPRQCEHRPVRHPRRS